MTTLNEDDGQAIRDLLVGHSVVKVDDQTLRLDDGTTLTLVGHEGGCGCGAGDYDLVELNGVDNVITNVFLANDPSGEDHPTGNGTYDIYVIADNKLINLARFEGSDGNGSYGTGYRITVEKPQPRAGLAGLADILNREDQ